MSHHKICLSATSIGIAAGRCDKYAVPGGSRCAKHAVIYKSKSRRQRLADRAARGYGKDWVALRNRHLATHPQCSQCGATSSAGGRPLEVDHVVPFQGLDDLLRLDPANLRTVCRACHNEKKRGTKLRRKSQTLRDVAEEYFPWVG
jgi:5-methylcytosine-specific restriction protein A